MTCHGFWDIFAAAMCSVPRIASELPEFHAWQVLIHYISQPTEKWRRRLFFALAESSRPWGYSAQSPGLQAGSSLQQLLHRPGDANEAQSEGRREASHLSKHGVGR